MGGSTRTDRFFAYFRQRLANIRSLEALEASQPSITVEQHILTAACIDALANYWGRTLPKKLSDRERMGQFLAVHGHPVFTLVSGPLLVQRAAREHPEWLAALSTILPADWQMGPVRRWTQEKPLDDLVARPAVKAAGIPEDWLRRSRLGEIIYKYYRCGWLHESRADGPVSHAPLPFFGIEPHYIVDTDNGFSLEIPLEFLLQAAEGALESFEKQCRESGLDPLG